MPVLSPKPRLAEFQAYVRELERERGFDGNPLLGQCLLLGEEVGELFKAIRKQQGLQIDSGSAIGKTGEELADILILTLSLANRLGVDLEQAFREKEAINHQRTWVRAATSLQS